MLAGCIMLKTSRLQETESFLRLCFSYFSSVANHNTRFEPNSQTHGMSFMLTEPNRQRYQIYQASRKD